MQVRSAFELPAAQQAAIQSALNETFAVDVPSRFETAPGMVSGIEISANGHKVSWSIEEYLASLEKGVDKLLQEPSKPVAKEARNPVVESGGAAAEAVNERVAGDPAGRTGIRPGAGAALHPDGAGRRAVRVISGFEALAEPHGRG